MEHAMIVDTETACIKDPIPVEVAAISITVPPRRALNDIAYSYNGRFNPGRDMDFGAVAAHNILPEDLKLCPPWTGDLPFSLPQYIVGHNVDFDLEVLYGTKDKIPADTRRICTLALCRWAYPDLDSHKLAAMMYAIFGLTSEVRDMVVQAHGAAMDAYMCLRITQFIAEHFTVDSWEELWKMSEVARLPIRMSFGKYGPKDGQPGMLIADMVKQDRGYIRWLFALPDLDPYLRKVLEKYS